MSNGPCLIGVDVGTTNVKVGAFTAKGQVVTTTSLQLHAERSRPGWAAYDPSEIWRQTARAIATVSRQISGRFEPLAIAVSSMGETGIAIDRHGLPVYEAIAWFDSRTGQQAEWWKKTFGPEFIFSRTGLPIQPIFGINKLSWIKENEPQIFSQIDRWLSVSDYINFCLCGIQAAELSLASRVMALDLRKRAWSEEILAAAGISPHVLGEPLPSGEVLGPISATAAHLTELPSSVRVVTGGHDHPCAAVGSGILKTGLVLDSLGTSESLLMVLDSPMLGAKAAHSGFAQGCHVLRDKFVCFGGLVTMGGAIDWVRKILFPEMDRGAAYQHLEELGSRSRPGSGGIYFVPSLRAASPPHNDPESCGVFIGLRSDSSLQDLARAVHEGLAFAAYDCLEAFRLLFDAKIERIRAVGGPVRNRLLMRIKAAVATVPFTVLEVEEAACRGASILAGLGVGVYQSTEDVAQTVEFRETLVDPPPEWSEIYKQRYDLVYRRIYPSVRDLHQKILEIEKLD
jgi:xylulokinase